MVVPEASRSKFMPTRDEYVDVVVHHKGEIIGTQYVGGEVTRLDAVDPDYVSYHELCNAVKRIGYTGGDALFYSVPEYDEQLILISCDRDIIEACDIARLYGEVHIYVKHKIDEPIMSQEELLLTYPAASPTAEGLNLEGANENGANDTGGGNTENDDWWNYHETEIDELISKSQSANANVNENVNESVNENVHVQFVDECDSDNSLDGLEAMTDDEEYIANRDMAKQTLRKFKNLKKNNNVDKGDGGCEGANENLDDGIENQNADAVNENVDNGTENVNVEGGNGDVNVGNGNDNVPTYFDFDVGGDFQQWMSDDGTESETEKDAKESSDEDDWIERPKTKPKVVIKFNPKEEIKHFDFCVDMLFEDATQLKDQVRAFAAQNGYPIWFCKNDKRRVQAKCTGCPWHLWASCEGEDGTFMIKSYQPNHKCSMKLNPRTANSTWLAKILGDRIRREPFMKLVDLQELVKEQVGVEKNLKLLMMTKRRALASVQQNMVEHYSLLWNYVLELGRTNPGSTIVLKGTDDDWVGPPQFRRFYVCFQAVKKGFIDGCRKFIGVDGCFLKTWIKGEVLIAMGRDANNQMFPVAWAVVEKEDQHTWRWFLNLVARDIGITDGGAGWTIMSDQQKGLELAVKESFPEMFHRNCARHIYANFRKRGYTGMNYRRHFWAAAKSTTKEEFQANMEKIKRLSEQAFKHLMDRNPARWSRAFFPLDSTCDCVDNNSCESFNFWIISARYKPLIHMLEDIRKQVMVRLRDKKWYMTKRLAEGKRFGHRIEKSLKESIINSRECHALWNGEKLFEIGGPRGGKTVNLEEKTCTCRAWQLCGIPCCHAVSAITFMREDPEDYVYECLKGETYMKCYATMMNPLNGKTMWPESEKPKLMPPPPRVLKGRPKWLRRKDALEDGQGSRNANAANVPVVEDPYKPLKSSRKGLKMTCSVCKKEGHNIRKCPDKPITDEPIEGNNSTGIASNNNDIASGSGSTTKKRGRPKKNVGGSSTAPPSQRQGQEIGNTSSGINTRSNGNGPPSVQAGLQPSFTKRQRRFITPQALQHQAKSKMPRN